ncbi:hypothetical protein M5E87_27530 [Flavonifractor plautii]|nr:hypothetical protein M5E87_27530 [Flavonifractor plautii]
MVPSEPGRDFVYYPEPENDYVFAVVGQMGLFLLILPGGGRGVRRRRLALPPLPAALPAARHASPALCLPALYLR